MLQTEKNFVWLIIEKYLHFLNPFLLLPRFFPVQGSQRGFAGSSAINFRINIDFVINAAASNFQFIMQYRTIIKRLNPFQQKVLTGLVTPWSEPHIFSMKLSQYTIIALVFSWILDHACFILLLKNRTNLAVTNLLFFLTLATILLNWLSIKNQRFSCYFELSMGFQTIFLPFMFTFSSAGSAVPFAYGIGFACPALLVYLAWRFVLAMAVYDKNVDFEPGIFPVLIRKQKIWLHHVFIAGVFGLMVVANLLGVFWRLFVYQLILIMPYMFQITLLERMIAGAKPNWKLTGSLAFANVVVLLYFQIITFWFNSF